jgi:hypothetical protein
MTLIRHASENWDIIFSQHSMNRTIRRTLTRTKSSSLPLDEASLLLADEPNANSQTDRSDYLNERNGLLATVEIRATLDRWTLTDYRVLILFV